MKKYTDVDIIAELQKLVDDHVDSYKEDFDIDKRIIRRAAESIACCYGQKAWRGHGCV